MARAPCTIPAMDVEQGRKLIHLAGGLIPLGYLWLNLTRQEALTILGILALPFLAVDFGRRYLPALNRAFLSWLGWAMREKEGGRLTGAFYALISAWFSILVFEKKSACAALLILAVGDTAASVTGKLIGGRPLLGAKTVSGSLAMLVSGSLVALPFVPPGIAVGGALAATAVELLPLPFDDNLSVPLAAGLTFWLLTG